MPRVWNAATEDYPAYAVPISRPTKLGNPFVIGPDGTREEVLAKYEAYVRGRPDLMERIRELRGKDLLCWCAPLPCHGDIIIRLSCEEVRP